MRILICLLLCCLTGLSALGQPGYKPNKFTTNANTTLGSTSSAQYPIMLDSASGTFTPNGVLFSPHFSMVDTNGRLSGILRAGGLVSSNGAVTGFAVRAADANGTHEWSTNFSELNVTNMTIVNNITVKNGGTLNLAGGSLSGDAYVIVGGSSIALTNGLNLLSAYTAATSKSPHGNALAANNRYTIFLVPGVYDLGSGQLALSAQFIDIIGLSENTGDVKPTTSLTSQGDTIITSSDDPVSITSAGQDITIGNLTLRTTTAGTDSCITTTEAGFGIALKVFNVLLAYGGAGNRITPWDKSFSGTWVDVRAYDIAGSSSSRAFGASVAGSITVGGTFIRCAAIASAWGGENNNGVTLSGTFIDCWGGSASFCGTSNGGTLSGTFVGNKQTGLLGVSAGAFMGSTAGTMSGYFQNNAGDVNFNNFGGGAMSGTMIGNSGTAAISWSSVTGKIVGNNFPGFTDNVMASRSVDAAVNIASTGWTNTYAKNATVYIDGTGLTFTVYNSAGTAIYTNAATVIHATVNLQPAGKVIITAGSGITGRATPL